MEMDNEVKGEGNSYTTHFRQMDPRLGRWFSLDPLARSFPHMSNYASMNNNPVLYKDVHGDSAFVFSARGHYTGTVDDGSESWGILLQFPPGTSDEEMAANNNASPRRDPPKRGFQYIYFNDPNTDVPVMKELIEKYRSVYPLVARKDENDVVTYLVKAGVDHPAAREDALGYAFTESRDGGHMDFWARYLGQEMMSAGINDVQLLADGKGQFFIFENSGSPMAYNPMDAGNYLWGGAMLNLGFPLSDALRAAHVNNAVFGLGGRDFWDFADSPYDQAAIMRGFVDSPWLTTKRSDPTTYPNPDLPYLP